MFHAVHGVVSRRRRLSRPSLFVLDDCHEAPDKVGSIVDRLQAEIGQGRLAFVCLVRRVRSDEPDRGDDWDLADDLSQQGAVIDFETSSARFRRVVATLKPAFVGLAPERSARLEALTGRDPAATRRRLVGSRKPRGD